MLNRSEFGEALVRMSQLQINESRTSRGTMKKRDMIDDVRHGERF